MQALYEMGCMDIVIALARIIPMLPDGYGSDRSRLVVMARNLTNRVMLYMGEDGSYQNVIDDPATSRRCWPIRFTAA